MPWDVFHPLLKGQGMLWDVFHPLPMGEGNTRGIFHPLSVGGGWVSGLSLLAHQSFHQLNAAQEAVVII
ncbi:UNVERIFIED_ORG: hypothetical protein M2154_003578 [Enterobacter sp. JUb101]|nr:hypothetical protein [Lelliottia amnigena]